jgi:hypothetical protein
VSHKGLQLLVKVPEARSREGLTGDKELQDQPQISDIQMHFLATNQSGKLAERVNVTVMNSNTNSPCFWGEVSDTIHINIVRVSE